ncbi:MAG: hypothetical protein WBB37_04670 [bacterium]
MNKSLSCAILVLLCSFLFTGCMSKKQWQGNYTTVSYTKIEPKEDFKCADYIIVSYTPQKYNQKSDVIYRFDIMKNDEIVRRIDFVEIIFLITFRKPDPNVGESGLDYDYALMETMVKDLDKQDLFILSEGETYKLYENIHDYEEIKGEVIDVLLGRELLPEVKK